VCLSCGCVPSGGSPTDDHGDPANLTLGDLTDAANAQGMAVNQAAQNICDSLATMEAAQEVEMTGDGGDIDVVVKALAVAPKRFVLGVAYPADRVDGHGEYMTADQLEATAWDYARNHRRIGFYHVDGTEGHADVVESYIYRGPDWVTSDIDGREQVIKAGDWVLGGILDEAGFDLVRRRKADGWSVDGMARRRRKLRSTVPVTEGAST
jgi:Putative phage serine protease XkdF